MMDFNKTAVQTLPVLPLRNLVLFPGVVLPVDVGRSGSLKLVEDVVKRQPSHVMIATQKDPQIEDPSPDIPDETGQILDAIREPSRLADIASANLDQSTEERMSLLGELDVAKRLKKVLESLQHRVQVFEVKEKIDTQVREEFSRHQR